MLHWSHPISVSFYTIIIRIKYRSFYVLISENFLLPLFKDLFFDRPTELNSDLSIQTRLTADRRQACSSANFAVLPLRSESCYSEKLSVI